MSEDELINYKPFWPETAVIWGSGASNSLGLPNTRQIGQIISCLTGVDSEGEFRPLKERIKKAFDNINGCKIHPKLEEAFEDLLLLLFDGDDSKSNAEALRLHRKQVEKLTRKYTEKYHLSDDNKLLLEHELFQMHNVYDWVGLRGVVKYIAKEWDEEKKKRGDSISLMDLLTTLDQLYSSDLAIPTEEIFTEPKNTHTEGMYLIDKHRLLAIKRCLGHLISSIQRIVIQEKPGKISISKLKPYRDITENLAELMWEESEFFLNRGYQKDRRQFYYFSYSFISFNWDPIMLWLIFHAHKKINDSKGEINEKKLHLFNDAGDGIGIRKILDKHDSDDKELLAFMMNESICKRINDPKYQKQQMARLVRVGKLLFPHAGLGWRVCSRCGKLFTDFGSHLEDIDSSVAFGPDLLPELNMAWKPRTTEEKKLAEGGQFGSIQCIFCGSMTKPYDSPLILQSAIKSGKHYALEGIFRELGLVIGNAKHLVLAGYTLPKDDLYIRCFFQAAWAGKNSSSPLYCSLVEYDPKYMESLAEQPVWLMGNQITDYIQSPKGKYTTQDIVKRYLELFKLEQLRVSLRGIPDTITKHPQKDTKEALIDLLYPKKCFPKGFPLKREI